MFTEKLNTERIGRPQIGRTDCEEKHFENGNTF